MTHFQCGLRLLDLSAHACICSPKKQWKEKITAACVSSSGHEKLGHLWARLQPCYRKDRLQQQPFPTARPIHSKQTTNSHKNTKNRDKWSKQSTNEWLKRARRDWSYHLDCLSSSSSSWSLSLYLSFSFSFSLSQMGIWRLNQLGCLCQCGFKPITRAQALIASKHIEIRSH